MAQKRWKKKNKAAFADSALTLSTEQGSWPAPASERSHGAADSRPERRGPSGVSSDCFHGYSHVFSSCLTSVGDTTGNVRIMAPSTPWRPPAAPLSPLGRGLLVDTPSQASPPSIRVSTRASCLNKMPVAGAYEQQKCVSQSGGWTPEVRGQWARFWWEQTSCRVLEGGRGRGLSGVSFVRALTVFARAPCLPTVGGPLPPTPSPRGGASRYESGDAHSQTGAASGATCLTIKQTPLP